MQPICCQAEWQIQQDSEHTASVVQTMPAAFTANELRNNGHLALSKLHPKAKTVSELKVHTRRRGTRLPVSNQQICL